MTPTRRSFFHLGAAALAAPALLGAAPTRAVASGAVSGTPKFMRRKVGALTVTVLLDGTIDFAPSMILGYDAAAAAATLGAQHLPPAPKGMPVPVLGYVIDTGSKRIAIDTGTFDGFAPNLGGYHAALAEAGYQAADIDTVLITHLHADHVGGLSSPDGKPLFENAEVMVSQTDWEFWHDDSNKSAFPAAMVGFFDIARNFIAPYGDRITRFADNAQIATGIQAVALPGHTPGHSGFQFHSEGQDILFWGDIIHMTKLQFANPDWLAVFDMDHEATRQSRKRMLDMAVADDMLTAGAHLDFPGFGHVERRGAAYHFAPAPFDYSA